MKSNLLIAILMVTTLGLVGCDATEHADLQAEMRELAKDQKGRVPPLPPVKGYESVPYAAFDLVDPFGPDKIKLLNPPKSSDSSAMRGPDTDRPKEPLEAFPVESLKMVGTLTRERRTWALVRADQGIFRVRVGNYLGQNFGVITKINDGEISLKELIQDGTGDWSERVSTLLLQETEAAKK